MFLFNMFSISFDFKVDRRVKFAGFSGFAVRGLFFDMLRRISPNLSNLIHDTKRIAPYSVKPIIDNLTNKVVYRNLFEGRSYSSSFCILDQNLGDKISDIINYIHEAKISEANIFLDKINVRILSFDELLKNSKPLDKFSIHFLSPTAFRIPAANCCKHCHVYKRMRKRERRGDKDLVELEAKIKLRRGVLYPMPDPKLAITNLIKVIEVYDSLSFNLSDFKDWLDNESIAISGYKDMKTLKVYEHPSSNKYFLGFVGKVNFSIRKKLFDEEKAKLVNALFKLGETINVGANRTAGMGMMKLIEPRP